MKPLLALIVTFVGSGFFGSLAWGEVNQSEEVYTNRRNHLIESVLRPGGIRDERVLQAIAATKRHEFVPSAVRDQAYLDRALPIGETQTISSPFIVALMTEVLKPAATDKVLEIGTGSGYQAAVLSPLVDQVYTIEIVEELYRRTDALLKRLGYQNIHAKAGDGYLGWPEHAPFDKIIVTCSPDKIPQPLIDQLKEGGMMVIPVGERYQQMLQGYRKRNGMLVSEYARPTQFVPMLGVAEANRSDRIDPDHPVLINGNFEAKAASGFIPHWYYDFGVALARDRRAPAGSQVARFHNKQQGQPSMLLQGLALDGRRVSRVRLSGFVTTQGVKVAMKWEEQPKIILQFLDENRNHIGYNWIGPFLGDLPWQKVSREIDIPIENREAIVMIGLFGAVGTASFDDLQLEVLERRPVEAKE